MLRRLINYNRVSVIQDDVQDGRQHIVRSRKLCKLVDFSSIFLYNSSFQLIVWSVIPSRVLFLGPVVIWT